MNHVNDDGQSICFHERKSIFEVHTNKEMELKNSELYISILTIENEEEKKLSGLDLLNRWYRCIDIGHYLHSHLDQSIYFEIFQVRHNRGWMQFPA